MGTRSLTHIRDNGRPLVTIYRQYDGYPSEHGKDVAEFLKPITLRNGYSGDDKAGTHANGMGCLAAQLIGHLKGDQIGNVYVYEAGATDCGEEYVYDVHADQGTLHLKCTKIGWGDTPDRVLFDGPVSAWVTDEVEKFEASA
jgi:hypothetical protein